MRNTAAVSRSTRRKCFKWFLNIAETLETVKFARSNPETLAPGECLKQKREGEGEEREGRGISKRGPTEECQFLIGRYAARPLCRVCDPLREFWIPFHPVVRLNPRGILEQGVSYGIDVPFAINSCRGSRKASLILRIAKIVSNIVRYVII